MDIVTGVRNQAEDNEGTGMEGGLATSTSVFNE